VTLVVISAKCADICIEFYTTVKHDNIHLTPSFVENGQNFAISTLIS